MASLWNRPRRSLRFAPLAFVLLGGCTTDGATFGLRPLFAVERSGQGAGSGAHRVPQMRMVAVPHRPARLQSGDGGAFMLPVAGATLTSTFGLRGHPLLGGRRMHAGLDLAAPSGTPIRAPASGIVDAAGPNGGYGNYIRIRHDEDVDTAYAHLSRLAEGIAPGTPVRQGQVIGYVGTTGLSTGPHLHWEVLVGGLQVDPLAVMPDEVQTALLGSGPERVAAALPVAVGGP